MSPETITALGLCAAFCTTSAFVPQVLQTFRTRHTKDISLAMYAILIFGILLWLVYGILNRDLPIILANGISFVLALCVLILKLRHG